MKRDIQQMALLANSNWPAEVIAPWRDARRILAVRLDNLGDVLVTTPAFRAIKESLPGASVTLFASPMGAQVGALDPDVDDVIVYSAPWMDPWRTLPQDSAREQRMIETLRAGRYDGAIIFTSYHESSLPAAYMCYLADIPLRAAASVDGPGSLLTTRHRHPDRMMHEVERGLNLVGGLGMRASGTEMRLRPTSAARRTARALLEDAGVNRRRPAIVVHPGCSMPARTYPAGQFAEIVTLLVRMLNARVFVTGAEAERPLVEHICEGQSQDVRSSVFPMAGKLAFDELCGLIEAASVTITNNTGPMHISAAVSTPVVALFALTNPPEQWGPWLTPSRVLYHDVPCRLCYSRACPFTHDCLRLVTPAMAVEAAAELLVETCDDETSAPLAFPIAEGGAL